MKLVLYVDQFPAISETFIVEEMQALRRLGHDVRVETASWADPVAEIPNPPRMNCLTDDSTARRAADLAWLVARRPRAVLGDLAARHAWRREEPVRPLRVLAPLVRRLSSGGERHVHVHFAGPAALDAMRLGRLAGVRYSVVAHAYDIYRSPANLPAKLRSAALAGGVCDATVVLLRQLAGEPHSGRVQKIAMGVDARRLKRRRPYPGGRHVVGVGRLVEKKGFIHLIEAAARLRDEGRALDRVTVVGDGPLRPELERRTAELGLERTVVFRGALQPAAVPEVLATADVLAMPSVVAPDGDRDALPVVVQEALAMEVPVVASDLVGLPEVVRDPWGALVPPGDPGALAAAIASILDRPSDERVAMGRAGRRFVVAERDPDVWAARLLALIDGPDGVPG